MPATGVTDPSALLTQRVGPAMAPGSGAGGGDAAGAAPPPGAQMGAQGPTQITPQMAQLAQVVQRLLMQQQGTDYTKKMLRRIGLMLKGVMNSQFMQNPPAENDLADAFKKMNSAVDKIDKTTQGSAAPAMQSMVADLMGNDAAKPPGATQPTPPAMPMSM